MSKSSITILGSGFSGLLLGAILSKEGFDVSIIEQNEQIGGSLQIFKRNGVFLDTGVHYVGSLGKGEVLNNILSFVSGLDRIDLIQLDSKGFDRLIFHNESSFEFKIPNGLDNYFQQLLEYFPSEQVAISDYIEMLRDVINSTPLFNLLPSPKDMISKWRTVGLKDFFKSINASEKLIKVLLGNNLLYAAHPDQTSVYSHALVVLSFLNSAWRIPGGSHKIAQNLAREIKSNGGRIYNLHTVKRIHADSNIITYVETHNGERFYSDQFISTIGLKQTFSIIENSSLRASYLNKYKDSIHSISAFTMHLFTDYESPDVNHYNRYHFFDSNIWTGKTYDNSNWPNNILEYTFHSQRDHQKVISIMSAMSFDECKQWESTFKNIRSHSDRGKAYEDWKQQKEEQIIQRLEQVYPQLSSRINQVYSSSPLTYRDYLSTDRGSMYGLIKSYSDVFGGAQSIKSKFQNLMFGGQDVNMHGLYGVALGCLQVASHFCGEEYLLHKIRNNV